MAKPGIEAAEGRGSDIPIFIRADLDDYPLTPIEFRVYGRLARRCGTGSAYESVPNMASNFGVSDRTVQRALRLLVEARIIGEERRPGKTTLYTLLPHSRWLPAEQIAPLRTSISKQPDAAQVVTPQPGVSGDTTTGGDTTTPSPHVTGDTRDGGVVTPDTGVVVTPRTDEGSPSEGTPLKDTQQQPPPQQPASAPSTGAVPWDWNEGHPAIAIYTRVLEHPPPNYGVDQIEADVGTSPTELAVWEAVCKRWKGNNNVASKVWNMLERYRKDLADEQRNPNGKGITGERRIRPQAAHEQPRGNGGERPRPESRNERESRKISEWAEAGD